jgi:hypothetical protein
MRIMDRYYDTSTSDPHLFFADPGPAKNLSADLDPWS